MKKNKIYWCGNHVFSAWTASNGTFKPIRKCIRCDYEQERPEYFFQRRKKIESMEAVKMVVNKNIHISLWW